ncbi:hypothetical protein GQ53DRAFT_874237 [Thozetella sp. PMI_491]|nr:hypothetical protein GQ53DRAFT_874237 [Thozetella sp. PMI_491]
MQLRGNIGVLFAVSSILLSGQLAAADHADGVSPYGDGFAPDVVSIDPAWNNTYPDYEGTSIPYLSDVDDRDNTTDALGLTSLDTGKRAAQGFYLRVMPLGASITEGVQSTDGNGYRKWLRSQLRWKGWNVNMVGSKQNGDMADRDNEGHPGWVITEIQSAFESSRWMMPNLVLINAGTNDCGQNIDTANAGQRLKVMIDEIFSSIPGVTVVVSTLVKSRSNDACAANLSQQYRDLVASYSKDTRIGLADIYSVISMDDLASDGIHPNDYGYKLFASVWWDAISKLEDKIQPPAAVAGIDDSATNAARTCAKVAGNARGPIQSQRGSGYDDGNYVHNRVERGSIESARIQKGNDPQSIIDATPSHMFFANIVLNSSDRSKALDDWIRIYHNTTGKNTYYYRQNLGGGKFGPSQTFDVGVDCDSGPRKYMRFLHNFTTDADDFYCLKPNSAMVVSLNRGGNPPRFESLGTVVPTHDGFVAADVRIADIDGDGRADYCLTNSDGTVVCSRNGGQGDSYTWQGFTTQTGLRGVVFDKRTGDKASVFFGDINGDFRSDFLYVGDQGQVETWINSRGWGSGIVPDWRLVGTTHGGMGTPGIRDQIKFARIYGSGRLDYVYLKEESTYFDAIVYENTGGGGTRRKADGNFYCDMRGTGSDDYVWIWSDGHAAEIFANVHNPPYWGSDTSISLSVPGPRVGIHVADWDGDGRCDVLVQNKATGALTLYVNQYDAGAKSITFVNAGVVTGATCTQGWGVSIFDRGMRLADIDGDGRADVLCLELDGRVTAWLNTKSGMQDVGQVKRSEGWDRANIRFADVESSGRADLIHLDKYTGAATVMKNNGHMDGGGGSSFSWTARGVLYSPIDRGETMHFTNQGGLGRADLVHVLPETNTAYTYFNECSGGSGGDDGTPSKSASTLGSSSTNSLGDPGLPALP